MARSRMPAFMQRIRAWHVAAVATSVAVFVLLTMLVAGAVQVGQWIYYRDQPVLVADIVGAWASDSSGRGRLTLKADGTAVADGFSYPGRGEATTGTGTWEPRDLDDRELRVVFDVSHTAMPLEQGPVIMRFDIEKSASGTELLTYVGDPDDPRNVRVFVRG